jgi:hypothetical protein
MSTQEDFTEGSIEDEVVYPNENDDLIPVMTEYIVDFLKVEKSNIKLFAKIYEKYNTIYAYEGSKKNVKGYIEFCLPSPLKEEMAMWRKYKYKKVDFKESSQLSQELICLQLARSNYRKNYATIERIYISIKKNYGDDVPKLPSAQKDSGKKSAKTESISDKMENLSMDITDIETETEPKDSENLKDTESADLRDLYRDDTSASNHSYTKEGYRIDDFITESSQTGSIPSRLFQYFDGDEHSELTESVKDYNFHPANTLSRSRVVRDIIELLKKERYDIATVKRVKKYLDSAGNVVHNDKTIIDEFVNE